MGRAETIVEEELRFLIPICLELKIEERNNIQKFRFLLRIFQNGGHKPEVVIVVLVYVLQLWFKNQQKVFRHALFNG